MVPIPGAAGHNSLDAASTAAVPEVQLVSIEHPCIVNDFHNGFKSLGGEQQVKQIFDKDSDGRQRKLQRRELMGPVVGVLLNPHDPLAKKLESTATSTNGVLVRVTVPRWTGRKRKRGTDSPFVDAASDSNGHRITAPDLIRRLRDNGSDYSVEAVGKIETSHRFNGLPDLRIRDADVPVMQELAKYATTPNYDVLKKFHIDLTPGTAGITALPRPDSFLPSTAMPLEDPFGGLPYPEGTIRHSTHNNVKKLLSYAPNIEIPPIIKAVVDRINAFLDQRPIATRRVLQYYFPDINATKLDAAATWVGHKCKGGPWKDCVVKAGVDPYSDPRYRFYQVVSVRPQNNKGVNDDVGLHIFDGVTKTKGRTYQLCDITDAALASVINTPNFRTKEEGYGGPSCGWYHNGSAAKIRTMMAEKLRRMHSDLPQIEDHAYEAVAGLPDMMDEDTVTDIDGMVFGADAKTLAMNVRKEALRLRKEIVYGNGSGGDANGDWRQREKEVVVEVEEGLQAGEGDGKAMMQMDPMMIDPELLGEGQNVETVDSPAVLAETAQPADAHFVGYM